MANLSVTSCQKCLELRRSGCKFEWFDCSNFHSIDSQTELEGGETYDEYWNACQLEMVTKGKMHGYMRMYWAKKVLLVNPRISSSSKLFDWRWSNGLPRPRKLFKFSFDSTISLSWMVEMRTATLVLLGYSSNQWFLSIQSNFQESTYSRCFGKHDTGWTERPIFGKLRYMNSDGLRRKFRPSLDVYVQRCYKVEISPERWLSSILLWVL